MHGLYHFVDASTVELLNGTKLEVDAVIYCTGYEPDFSLLGPDLDPTKRSNGKTGSGLARLYQNIFPPKHSDSVAYMNYARINMGADTTLISAPWSSPKCGKGDTLSLQKQTWKQKLTSLIHGLISCQKKIRTQQSIRWRWRDLG